VPSESLLPKNELLQTWFLLLCVSLVVIVSLGHPLAGEALRLPAGFCLYYIPLVLPLPD
jgi:hypothetical protein